MDARDEILARMYVMLTLLCLVPIAVGLQVLRVGVVDGEELQRAGERQRNAVVEIPAMRGNIVDRAGRTLVVNTARYDIGVDPTVAGFDKRAEALYASLSKTTGRSVSSYRSRVRNRSSSKYALLERGLSTPEVSGLERAVPGLILQARHSRTYNHGELAAHLLGHVDADLHGMAGLENQYDTDLTGVAGKRDMRRDRRGRIRPAADGAEVLPDHGSTVVLTVDLARQTILEEELAKGIARAGARWGTAIAMDPKTGAILAMANAPTYDPNRPGAADTFERRNHAIVDMVEPGSTFKLITAIAALSENVVSLGDTVDTGPGWAMLHGRLLRDTHAYGRIPFKEVIAVSSNIGSARIAERTGKEAFYRTARDLGFGMPTGIDLPGEIGGRLKRITEWSGPTLSAMSRGYEVQATPLQILTAYAALANRGILVRPFVVQEIRDVTGYPVWQVSPDSVRRAIPEDVAEALIPAFEMVVTDGTAKQAAVEDIRVAGKTGTAWKWKDGAYSARHSRASFVGFFPADDPKVVMLVMMDEPKLSIYGGVVAAPVFSEVARRWMPGLAEDADAMPATADSTVIPSVRGLPTELAIPRVLAAAARPSGGLDRDGAVVTQSLSGGSAAALGARVRLESAAPGEAVTMPDLRGWTVREATYWMASLGARVQVRGSGSIQEQRPSPGNPIPERVVLTAGD